MASLRLAPDRYEYKFVAPDSGTSRFWQRFQEEEHHFVDACDVCLAQAHGW